MEQVELNVKQRESLGKGASKKIKREGYIPAVVYGGNEKPLHVSVKSSDLKKFKLGGTNVIYSLKVEGKKKSAPTVAIITDTQSHFVKNDLIHIDFKRISLDKPITVEIAVHPKGKSAAVKAGGILEQHTREIEIECLPCNIPASFDVDISELKLGESIHVSDLQLSEGIKVLTDKKRTLFTISEPRAVEEVSKEEAEEKLKKSLGEEEA